MPPADYWANIPPPKRPARREPPHPGRQPVAPPQEEYVSRGPIRKIENPPRECMPMQNQNQPNYQQYPPQNYPPQPQPQPQQQGYYDESQLPLHLRRGVQFQRNAPRMPQAPQQQMPENMQKRYAEIESYYQANPQPTEPAPKHSRFNLYAILMAAFIGVSVLGIIGAVMNFAYSRGNANLATSVSFLHAELAVMFIAMILLCISSIVRK